MKKEVETQTISMRPDIPSGVKKGDFLVVRYTHSEWAQYWDDWHHAGLIVNTSPITVVEATGLVLQKKDKRTNKEEIREGVVKYEFEKQRWVDKIDGIKIKGNLYLGSDVIEIKWVRPRFRNPLREKGHWLTPVIMKKILTETVARSLVVSYALAQMGEPFTIATTKFHTGYWYCSKLIFKSYTMTLYNMNMETKPVGIWVTPEDLVDSRKTEVYHTWKNKKHAQ
jgi:uncharacterized protein YycO